MVGAICRRDILAHPLVTVRSFGWQVFVRALLAGRNETFLSLVAASRVSPGAGADVPESLARAIELELAARRVYESLAAEFACDGATRGFFGTLARHEQEHAELLGICRTTARRGGRQTARFDPWKSVIPELERQMRRAGAALDSVAGRADALRLVIEIESSELNRVFRGIVAASDSPFVRALGAFQRASQRHIAYICSELPKIEPALSGPCRRLTGT